MPCPACVVLSAEHLGMQAAAVSHHLAKLRLAGVVTTRRDVTRR